MDTDECRRLFALSGLLAVSLQAADWPQDSGVDFGFTSKESSAPSEWSVSLGKNIAWRTALPETGQSSAVISGDRLFLTTMKPVEVDTPTGKDIVAYCLSKSCGSILWQREIPGGYATRMSAPFGDASSPAAVADGKRVWFLNPTGRIACLDFEGQQLWEKAVTSDVRTRPILHDGKVILHKQVYLPDEGGHFTHEYKDAPLEQWTQLQALDATTGDVVWTSSCGVNMGSVMMLQYLPDGTAVFAVGRGGGHGPPEKPEGVSLIRADNGKTLWTLPLDQFSATQTFPVVDGQVLVFHQGEHLWVDAKSGEISRRVTITEEVDVRRWSENGFVTAKDKLKKGGRGITQQSNLRVGDFNYFRSYTRNYLGRVHVRTGKVEYLELPLQIHREPGKPEKVLWNGKHRKAELADLGKRKGLPYTLLRPNETRNSRGFQVMGDGRSIANGWGHTASPVPTAFGNRLFVPILCGLVFVIHADAETLDENAILGMNDLGLLGDAFTRSSITTDGKRLFAHTIKEVIAIGN